MSRYLAFFPMASSTSWKKTNHQQNQQKAMSDPTATATRSAADRKNSSGPKLDRQRRRSVAERNCSGPKLDRQPRRSVAERNSSGPKLDRQPRSSVAERNSSGPKLDGQPRRSVAERKPKTSLFGTDSLQRSALGIHDHAQNRPRSTRSCRWARRASAASLSTNGSAAQARSRR